MSVLAFACSISHIGPSSSEAFTSNGKTLTEAEWEFEGGNYLQEQEEGRFFALTGMTREQFVNWDKNVQKHLHGEQNLKKRKPAWEAFMN